MKKSNRSSNTSTQRFHMRHKWSGSNCPSSETLFSLEKALILGNVEGRRRQEGPAARWVHSRRTRLVTDHDGENQSTVCGVRSGKQLDSMQSLVILLSHFSTVCFFLIFPFFFFINFSLLFNEIRAKKSCLGWTRWLNFPDFCFRNQISPAAASNFFLNLLEGEDFSCLHGPPCPRPEYLLALVLWEWSWWSRCLSASAWSFWWQGRCFTWLIPVIAPAVKKVLLLFSLNFLPCSLDFLELSPGATENKSSSSLGQLTRHLKISIVLFLTCLL